MTTAVTRTSKVVKNATTNIRSHFDVVERAREIYLTGIKRLEAEYYERIKRATAVITGEDPPQPVQEEIPGTNGPEASVA